MIQGEMLRETHFEASSNKKNVEKVSNFPGNLAIQFFTKNLSQQQK